jgi:hypothetical protein
MNTTTESHKDVGDTEMTYYESYADSKEGVGFLFSFFWGGKIVGEDGNKTLTFLRKYAYSKESENVGQAQN